MNSRYSNNLLTGLFVLGGMSLVFQVFQQSIRGFDFTDEGLYALAAQSTFNDISLTSPYGAIAHFLYLLCFNNLWVYRFVGFVLLIVAFHLLNSAVIGFFRGYFAEIEKFASTRSTLFIRWSLETTFATLYYGIGLATPSYNWMNLLGLLIGFAGVIEIYNSRSFLYKKGFFAYLLFLLGTILASYAKFSSGVFLLVMLVGLQSYIFVKHRGSNNYSLHFANFIFVSSVMILVYIVDLSGRIKESRFIAVTLAPNFYTATSALNAFVEGLIQTPRMALSYMGIPAWLFISGTLMLLALAILNNYPKIKFNALSLFDLDLILVAYVLTPIVLGFHFNMWNGHDPNSENQYLALWLLWFCSFVAVVIKLVSVSQTKHLLRIVMLNSLVLLSLVYAFGGGDGIVLRQTGSAGVYLLVAFLNALVLSGSRSGFVSIIATGVVISIGMVSVYQSNEFPYRRLPTYQQNVAYEIGLSKTTIYMDPHTVKSLNSVKSEILQGGWSQENPIIDATGHNPGLIFALGATTIRTLMPTWWNCPGTAIVFEYSLDNLLTSEKLNDPEKYWFMIEDSGLLGTNWNTSSSLVAFIESKLKIKIELVGKFGSIGIYKPMNT